MVAAARMPPAAAKAAASSTAMWKPRVRAAGCM
jgi:hypothetical protein